MASKIEVPNFGTPAEGTKMYRRFSGVDFSSDETQIADHRSPYAINMISDEGGFPEKRVGWRTLLNLGSSYPINGIFTFYDDSNDKTIFLIHAGSYIYKWDGESTSKTQLYSGAKTGGITSGFYMNSKLYLLTGAEYLVFDGSTVKKVAGDDAYIPTTTVGMTASGAGTTHEKVNLLTRFRKNNFSTTEKVLQLDVKSIDSYTPVVTYTDGSGSITVSSYSAANGTVTLASAPKLTTEGIDNITVKFAKTISGYADRINKCTIAATYGVNSDNRVFLSGNDDAPNQEWYSGLADPTYMPDDNYFLVGSDDFPIMCYLKNQGELLVIKEDNRQEGTIWHHTAELDASGIATFPLREGVTGYGCMARYSAGNLLDDPLFLSPRGVYAPVTNVTAIALQRKFYLRSERVNRQLNHEHNRESATAAVWKGRYILVIDGKAYVADGNQSLSEQGYEWFYWENIPARVMRAVQQTLYFGTADGRICRMNDDLVDEVNEPLMRAYNDDGAAIYAEWRTKLDTMDSPMRLKTMPKRGSGVHLKAYSRSEVEVYIRTEADFGTLARTYLADRLNFRDIDFERFTFSTVNQQILPLRVKKKKWKAIQVKLVSQANNEAFGVHSVVIRFLYGNYAKR